MGEFRIAPAGFWRAFFIAACVALSASAAPPLSNQLPPLAQPRKFDPAEGRKVLEQLRSLGIAGDYYLEFELRVLPRRGEERVLNGQLWGSRNATGPVTRVQLNYPATPNSAAGERRFLIQNGPESAVWRRASPGNVEMLGVSALFDPVAPGTDLTAFDLQMPFIYWNDFSFEGLVRFHGRPAYVLLLKPPAEVSAQHRALSGVRVHLDTQFNALMQTELVNVAGTTVKTLTVLDLKKVGDQWIVKEIDARDDETRNKTRFTVIAAGLGLDFSRSLFEPAQLDENIRPPPASRLVRIAP